MEAMKEFRLTRILVLDLDVHQVGAEHSARSGQVALCMEASQH